ncbi:hypothetical protein M501DRAFT_995722 [Patellaria atrata CBS 101060]|uniref:Cupin type-2 domain-containing protein n=1 Tax=Patellaria atrata CBS 101060 TaxID=1346257 RepID=A0A9P4S6S4_9PEZI|nr:hypothetical protein M501DRAFT_995722 [Patellaria atrata CBS 101060]
MATKQSISSIINRPLPNGVTYNLTEPSQTTITLPPGSTWTSGLHWHETHTEYLRVVKGSIRVTLDGKVTIITASPSSSTKELTVRVDRGVRHEWGRADSTTWLVQGRDNDVRGDEEAIVVESTDPNDGEKSIFFYNVNGVILDAQKRSEGLAARRHNHSFVLPKGLRFYVESVVFDLWVTVQLFTIFHTLDNWPVLVDLNSRRSRTVQSSCWKSRSLILLHAIEWGVTHAVLSAATLIGRLVGIDAVREEYTPPGLRSSWKDSGRKRWQKDL